MRKKKLYVVGYDGDREVLFGKNAFYEDCIFPFTSAQAKSEFKSLDKNVKVEAVIYKLVKVDPKKI